MYFSKVTPLKTNIFLLKNWWVRKMNLSPKKVIPFFGGFSYIFRGGEEGSSITPQAPPKKNPIALRLMYALRRLSRQQWACGLVSYQIDPSTLRHVGLPVSGTPQGALTKCGLILVDTQLTKQTVDIGYVSWRDCLFVREDVKFTNIGSTIRKKSEVLFSIQLSNCCGMHFITWNPLSHSANMASEENCVSFFVFWLSVGMKMG